MSRYTLPVVEDPDTGELMIEFTEEILQELDWGLGTVYNGPTMKTVLGH